MAEERSVLQKIGDAIADYAPALAGVLTATGVGVPAAAAVAAVGGLARTFGLGSDAKPEEVLAAISADPEIRLKAMIAEQSFKAEMGRQEIEKLKAQLADVQGARTMRTEHEKITGKSDYNLYFLAWTIVVGFFALMGLLFHYTLPPDQNGVIFVLFGALASGFGQVLSFFFGSNKSSENKTAMIYNSTPGLPKKEV